MDGFGLEVSVCQQATDWCIGRFVSWHLPSTNPRLIPIRLARARYIAPRHKGHGRFHLSSQRTSNLAACLSSTIDSMSALVLKDIRIELATRDDCFLIDISHLLLEVKINGRVAGQINLLSLESTRGAWDTEQSLALAEVNAFFLSVILQMDENDRQIIGFIELHTQDLYPMVGREYETPLMSDEGYPSLVLRARIDQQTGQSKGDGAIQKMVLDGFTAFEDFQSHKSLQSLDLAISKFEAATSLFPKSDPRLHAVMSSLGICLRYRFEEFGRIADINHSIQRLEVAAGLTDDTNPHRPVHLSELGGSPMRRFERLGNVADIDAAISHQQAAVHLTPDGDSSKPDRLSYLGNSLMRRFERFGDISDIDSAIRQGQTAIRLAPDGHSSRAACSNNLGNAFRHRFVRLGNVADIDSAIDQLRTAVIITPDGDRLKPSRFNNLGLSLMLRYERLGNVADIDEAIIQLEKAIHLTPDGNPSKSTRLNNLGTSFVKRFDQLGNIADIDAAINHQQAAVKLTPDRHPYKAICLHNLGHSLGKRFARLRNTADIDGAISQLQSALDLTPDSHPQKATHLHNLGINFGTRFLHSRNPKDAEMTISHLSAAALSSVASPTERFKAVRRWIFIASFIKHPSLLAAYKCALELMPLVAWLGLPIADRHEHLAEIGEIARDAAATAISLEQYNLALEWLEQGRSIVWNQIIQLRTPVDDLRKVDPDLADRLLKVSRLLDRGMEAKETVESIEEEGQRYRALTSEWESIITQVRSLPRFEDFLKPPQISQLMGGAQNGPVVIFNVAKERCDALALVPGFDEVIHIPLPNVTLKSVTELRDEFKDMLYSNGMRVRGERAAKKLEDEEEFGDCKPILAELWHGLVKPVLDSLAFSAQPEVLPRIWWCATGPLAFLPLHAAGLHDENSDGTQTSDYVISSYTPTLSSLLHLTDLTSDSPFRLLSVIQPSAPGVSSIPNTKEELECIQRRLGNREHTVLNGEEGTKRRVTKAMAESNWVHLACHGSQRQDEPTKSALILEDGHLTLEEIIKLNLPKAEFAFLSACQTTTGEEKLSDEAVHIAGGMLLAGYRGVVATMWSIQDDIAPEVADEFYRRIMADEGRPDTRKAAEALHYSIQKLRKNRGIPLTSWIPFVHLGA